MRLSRRAAMILITASVATSAPYAKAALFTWTNASGGNQDDYTAK
jgi:hypothetical protein